MKFRADRDDLAEALAAVQRGVSNRPGIPALTGVYIEATEDGGLVLTTTDLEVSTRLNLAVQVEEAGVALIPARLLGEIVKLLPQAVVTFTADGGQASILCQAYEGVVRLLPSEDFPSWQRPDGIILTVPAADFSLAVSQVARAASRDEARPTLTGVLLELSGSELAFAATDSYRLAVRMLPIDGASNSSCIIPNRAIGEMSRVAGDLDAKSNIKLYFGSSQTWFEGGDFTMSTRLIEGQFPNYRQLLPDHYENQLRVNRRDLLAAVHRVGILARENTPLRFEFNALGVRLTSSSPDLGNAIEAIEGTYEGEDMTVAFNPGYFADGLLAVGDDEATIQVRDGLKPGVIRGESADFTYIVMPVRIPAPVG